MTVLIDPNIYCYTTLEWQNGSFAARLESLLEMLIDIEDAEDQIEVETQQIFLLPDDIILSSYSMNPNINEPPNSFYYRQYLSKILPALQARRAADRPQANEGALIGIDIEFDDCIVQAEMREFLHQAAPADIADVDYVYSDDKRSFVLGSGVFSSELSISSIRGRYFLDERRVYPLEEKRDPVRALIAAIEILKERAGNADPTWNAFKIGGLLLHDNFLPSVARADFRDFVDEYQARVLYSILQIITTRNLTINEHSMKPQKVKFNGKSHGKWNAYVFQNGPCEHDLRCSRIYFAKVDGGILLHEYVESAH